MHTPNTASPLAWARVRQRLFESALAGLFVALVAPAVAGVAAFAAWSGLASAGAGAAGTAGSVSFLDPLAWLGALTAAYLLGTVPSLLAGLAVPFLVVRTGRHPGALLAGLGAALLWAFLTAHPVVTGWAAPAAPAAHAAHLVLPACAALGVYVAVLLHLRSGQ